jgi:hypothetical protein
VGNTYEAGGGYTPTTKTASSLAAGTLNQECALSDIVNQAYALTLEEPDLV